MKHSHRPPRHRTGTFPKGPKEGGEGRFQKPGHRFGRKFRKPEDSSGGFESHHKEEAGGRFQRPEHRPGRKFHKDERRSDGFEHAAGERAGSRFQRSEHRPHRKFHKPEHGGDSFQRNTGEEPDRRFQRPEHRPGRKFHKPERREDRRPHKSEYVDRKLQRPETPAPKREESRETRMPREGVLLWGMHAVREAWLNPKRRCIRLWATEGGLATFEKTRTEAKDALINRPDPKKVERHELDRLAPPGSVHQGLLIEAMPLPEPLLHEVIGGETPPDLVIALDQVTDPHNVGAIARSAATLGAGAIIMTERNAPGLTGVLAKAASGAIEHVPLLHIVNLARAIEELQQAGYWCIGLAEEGEKNLAACDLSGRTAIILGAEGEGLRQLTRKKCDELARLPTQGPIGSLNVSNAAAVALYEARRQKLKFSSTG